jgi:hypothetical protein
MASRARRLCHTAAEPVGMTSGGRPSGVQRAPLSARISRRDVSASGAALPQPRSAPSDSAGTEPVRHRSGRPAAVTDDDVCALAIAAASERAPSVGRRARNSSDSTVCDSPSARSRLRPSGTERVLRVPSSALQRALTPRAPRRREPPSRLTGRAGLRRGGAWRSRTPLSPTIRRGERPPARGAQPGWPQLVAAGASARLAPPAPPAPPSRL